MAKKVIPEIPVEIPLPGKQPEVKPQLDPAEPGIPIEDPIINPGGEPSEIPAYDFPSPPGSVYTEMF